jgi:hypothetical protein
MNGSEKPETGGTADWTMSDEREMLEKIVYHRFNFFMVLVTIIGTSFIRSDTLGELRMALGSGFGLSILFFFTLRKNQKRLNAALNLLVKIPEHPVAVLDRTSGPDASKGIIGYAIPIICIVSLALANILIWLFPPGTFK